MKMIRMVLGMTVDSMLSQPRSTMNRPKKNTAVVEPCRHGADGGTRVVLGWSIQIGELIHLVRTQ